MKSLETGASRTVSTDESGDYTVLGLPLGPQEVKAEKPGFKTVPGQESSWLLDRKQWSICRLELGELSASHRA